MGGPVDYDFPSMFHNRDPLLELARAQPHERPLVVSGEEAELALAVKRLVATESLGRREVRLDWVSGLSAVKGRADYGTLQAFGDQLVPRREWGPGRPLWYGFETESDWARSWGGVLGEHRDPLVYHRTWDDRWFFSNSAAAHRLAAAARQDREQGRGTTFEARVVRERVDPAAAALIVRSAVGLYLAAGAHSAVVGLLSETDYRPLLPGRVHRGGARPRVLWLPRSDERTPELAEAVTRAAPRTHVFDVTGWIEPFVAG